MLKRDKTSLCSVFLLLKKRLNKLIKLKMYSGLFLHTDHMFPGIPLFCIKPVLSNLEHGLDNLSQSWFVSSDKNIKASISLSEYFPYLQLSKTSIRCIKTYLKDYSWETTLVLKACHSPAGSQGAGRGDLTDGGVGGNLVCPGVMAAQWPLRGFCGGGIGVISQW